MQLFFPLGELGVEKLDCLTGFIAVTGQIFLDKNVDHFLNDIAGQNRIFSVRKIARRRRRNNLEQIVFFRFDLDALAQHFYLASQLPIAGDRLVQSRCANDFFQIDGRSQSLLHTLHILFALARIDADLVGQYRLHLDRDTSLRFIAIGYQGDNEPAHKANAPGNSQR